MTGEHVQLIGYWMSEKKIQKLNRTKFLNVFRNHGYELVKIDFDKPLDTQGPFVAFLHKLTDFIALANRGDRKSQELMMRIESWILRNPLMKIIDPIDNVRKLMDRYLFYSIVHKSDLFKYGIFTPAFAEITTQNPAEIALLLQKANVQYPFICKPSEAQGSKQAHKLSIIFNEKHLSDCEPPCVAQSFINHNAVIHKIFIIGNQHYVVEKPSLKNFYPCERETIFFDSQLISKIDSQSILSILDPEDLKIEIVKPDPDIVSKIVCTVRKELGMTLLGVDVIIENATGKCAIVDINTYPGYDGVPNLYEALASCVEDTINSSEPIDKSIRKDYTSRSFDQDLDSGFDTGDSSDERAKKKAQLSSVNFV